MPDPADIDSFDDLRGAFDQGLPIDPHRRWMWLALEEARMAAEEDEVPVGAIVVAAGRVVASAHNQREQLADPTAHAEVDCIRRAGRRRDWRSLTLVSTLSPCCMCSGTAILFKIPRVVIGENHTFMGAEEWMAANGAELVVVQDPRCVALMERMKREKPDLWAEDIGE